MTASNHRFKVKDGSLTVCVSSCNIVANTGNIAHEGTNMWTNVDGGDAFQYHAFYEDNNYNGEYIAWDNSPDRFYVSDSIYFAGSTTATGSKSFVQLNPTDPEKVIRYATLEGPEVGIYWRGSAELVDGSVRIDFPPEFTLVLSKLDPITASVTLTSDANGVFVAEKALTHITVRETGGGTSDATFDFVVYGIRDGYSGFEVNIDNTFGLLPGVPIEDVRPHEHLMQHPIST